MVELNVDVNQSVLADAYVKRIPTFVINIVHAVVQIKQFFNGKYLLLL